MGTARLRPARRAAVLAAALAASVPTPRASAQQVVDTAFRPVVGAPAYPAREGPVVLVDEGHGNFHTRSDRYLPFARLLEHDGYVVRPATGPFRRAALDSARVLVVANALHPSNRERWSLPTPSAFGTEEIAIVRAWVEDGGSLFLVADHMPFPAPPRSWPPRSACASRTDSRRTRPGRRTRSPSAAPTAASLGTRSPRAAARTSVSTR
jgi:hypothetical protein